MAAFPPRTVLVLATIAATLLVAGCESDRTAEPTPGLVAARVYVLAPRDVSGYSRTADSVVSPATLADQHHDAALTAKLTTQGFLDGALDLYSPSKNSTVVLPFQTISSQAIIFADAGGAAAFFRDEQQRVNKAPPNGTITPLVGVPNGNADALVAFDSTAPPAAPTDPASRAFLALIRRGQVVVELYAVAGPNSATPDQFVTYIRAQEELLAAPVRGG